MPDPSAAEGPPSRPLPSRPEAAAATDPTVDLAPPSRDAGEQPHLATVDAADDTADTVTPARQGRW